MTAAYVPQAGHRIVNNDWQSTDWFDVEALSGSTIFGFDSNGTPDWISFDADDVWTQVEKPRLIPEHWTTIDHADNERNFYGAALHALKRHWNHDTYRIWSDADGTPRIERVTA